MNRERARKDKVLLRMTDQRTQQPAGTQMCEGNWREILMQNVQREHIGKAPSIDC